MPARLGTSPCTSIDTQPAAEDLRVWRGQVATLTSHLFTDCHTGWQDVTRCSHTTWETAFFWASASSLSLSPAYLWVHGRFSEMSSLTIFNSPVTFNENTGRSMSSGAMAQAPRLQVEQCSELPAMPVAKRMLAFGSPNVPISKNLGEKQWKTSLRREWNDKQISGIISWVPFNLEECGGNAKVLQLSRRVTCEATKSLCWTLERPPYSCTIPSCLHKHDYWILLAEQEAPCTEESLPSPQPLPRPSCTSQVVPGDSSSVQDSFLLPRYLELLRIDWLRRSPFLAWAWGTLDIPQWVPFNKRSRSPRSPIKSSAGRENLYTCFAELGASNSCNHCI